MNELQAKMESKMYELLWQYELNHWTVSWFGGFKVWGMCCWSKRGISKRQIQLNYQLLELHGEERFYDTLLHELAHALDYESRGRSDHGIKWKLWAEKVGAIPEQYDIKTKQEGALEAVKQKYQYKCETCGKLIGPTRIWKREKSCGDCCRANGGGFQERFKLVLQ